MEAVLASRTKPLVDRLTDILFVMSGPGVYANFMGDRRWQNAANEKWLTTTIESTLNST